MNHEEKNYRVLLYQGVLPDEFYWSEMRLYGFLGTRLGSQDAAAKVLAEVDESGTATRLIEYASGLTAKVTVSLRS